MPASNPILRRTLVLLERAGKEQDAPIWRTAAKLLGRTASERVHVNVGRLSRLAGEGTVMVVPGKVLGSGMMEKKAVVGAFSFSSAARSKIVSKGGSALTIEELVKGYPKGSGVKLVE